MARGTPNKAELEYRLKRLNILAPWYGRTMVTLAAAVPAGVTTWLLRAFAGKTTDLKISAVAGVSLSANIVMSTGVWRKNRAMELQARELDRLRGRLEQREADTLGINPRIKGRKQ